MFSWLGLNPTLYAIGALALISTIGSAYIYGRHDGFMLAESTYREALLEAQQKAIENRAIADQKEQARLVAQAAADAAAQQLEDQANADHSGSDACLSPDRVRRIQSR